MILEAPQGERIQYILRFNFDASNNEAEYEELLAGMKLAQAAGAKYQEAFSDSQLVVNQTFEKFELKRVPRSDNEEADQLAKLASSLTMMKDRSIILLTQEHSEIEEVTKKVLVSTNRPYWKDAIEAYLTTGSLPLDKKEARKAEYVLREVHEGSCGNHSGWRSLAGKVLRQGYFWPSMQRDFLDMVRRCRKCQEHANIMHVPTAPMQPIPNPCPFDQWGMDLVGKLPRATRQREYLIVVVDYFSKWVEAEPLSKISEKEVIKFVWRNIICHFGIPRAFLTDNGTQFQGKEFKRWCLELKIKQYFTSLGTPQFNGQTEVTNRTILQHLKARLDETKGNWVDELPGVLWAYRTIARKSTGESPFNLIYGTEAVIPAEIGEETLRIQQYKSETNGVERRADLDLLGEVRNNASVRAEVYERRMAKAYNM
ncbi:UNVERIFIED_CONTAM: hypothetical protein Slati_4443400 [Sesamum latifolium]|uniref:Integrase catalytic domain-containing protein n=1 Tax=Sesamum latifolium TaxID=2727402 RepID=A0AAW2SQR4_9LAMI